MSVPCLWVALPVQALFQLHVVFGRPDSRRRDRTGDERLLGGLKAHYRRRFVWHFVRADTTLGVSVRHDSIANTLYHAQARQRIDALTDHDVRETSLGCF